MIQIFYILISSPMDVSALKSRMEEYVRVSGQIALGQRSQKDDIVERIAGKAIFRVSTRFINIHFIDKFVENSDKEKNADAIYRDWNNVFGKAVYDEFDEIELTKIEHEYRESAKSMYEMWAQDNESV